MNQQNNRIVCYRFGVAHHWEIKQLFLVCGWGLRFRASLFGFSLMFLLAVAVVTFLFPKGALSVQCFLNMNFLIWNLVSSVLAMS